MNRQMETALQRSQADLQAATNAKFAKDGEVTILRKGMEKVLHAICSILYTN